MSKETLSPTETAEVPVTPYTSEKLEMLIKTLICREPFFGYTLSKIDRVIDPNLDAPAALDINSLNILINPIKFAEFTEKEQYAVLKHEVLHYAMRHPQRFRAYYDLVVKNHDRGLSRRLNIAMDAAINQLIDGIPENCVDMGTINDIVDMIFKEDPAAYGGGRPNVLEKQASEYYFKLINHTLKDESKLPGKGGDNPFKEHDHLFTNSSQFNTKEMDNIISGAIERQRAHDKTAGTAAGCSILDLLPQNVENVHDEIWKKLVNKMFGEDPSSDKDHRYGRPNRRKEGCYHYKVRRLENRKVYIGIDTSASITDETLSYFLGYVSRGMKKHNTQVTLIQCDTQVDPDSVKTLRRILPTDVGFEICGRGGTNLTKILDYIEKTDPHAADARMIMLTDGYTPWRKSQIKTAVIYTEHHSKMKDIDHWAVLREPDVFSGAM
jgi:predicted metal-dependent peptidase